MAEIETAQVDGVVIAIPSTRQAFLIEKDKDFFGRESSRVTPITFPVIPEVHAPEQAAPSYQQAVQPASSESLISAGYPGQPLISKEQREKLVKEADEALRKAGVEARKYATIISERVKAFLEARKRASEKKLDEGVEKEWWK